MSFSTSAAVPNAALQTNDKDTDDDYFAFAYSADTEASQAASDRPTTNKCDLEVLQFLDDSKKDLEMFNRYQVVKTLIVQHN